jgi:hypothetical protein
MAWPVISRQRDGIVAWARPRTGVFPRVVLSLLDRTPKERLAQSLQSQGVRLGIKRGDAAAVLLVN